MSQAGDVSEEESPLVLRVLRLARPLLQIAPDVSLEPGELSIEPANDPSLLSAGPGFTSNVLVTTKFGQIYLGERLRACLRVFNRSPQTVSDIVVKVELQSTMRHQLLDTSTTPRKLAPNAGLDFFFSHELRELQLHIIMCTVLYLDRGNERKWFRQYFRFNVLNPLAITTKLTQFKPDAYYLEARMHNQTNKSITLQRVLLDASPHVVIDPLPASSPNLGELRGVRLQPNDERQVLIRFSLADGARRDSSLPVGKITVNWISSFGEPGELSTLPIVCKPPGPLPPLQLHVSRAPSTMPAEAPFEVHVQFTNNTTQPMNLFLSLLVHKMTGVLPCGISSQVLGSLAPSASVAVPLAFVGVSEGVHWLTGFLMLDQASGRRYEFDNVASVLVQRAESHLNTVFEAPRTIVEPGSTRRASVASSRPSFSDADASSSAAAAARTSVSFAPHDGTAATATTPSSIATAVSASATPMTVAAAAAAAAAAAPTAASSAGHSPEAQQVSSAHSEPAAADDVAVVMQPEPSDGGDALVDESADAIDDADVVVDDASLDGADDDAGLADDADGAAAGDAEHRHGARTRTLHDDLHQSLNITVDSPLRAADSLAHGDGAEPLPSLDAELSMDLEGRNGIDLGGDAATADGDLNGDAAYGAYDGDAGTDAAAADDDDAAAAAADGVGESTAQRRRAAKNRKARPLSTTSLALDDDDDDDDGDAAVAANRENTDGRNDVSEAAD